MQNNTKITTTTKIVYKCCVCHSDVSMPEGASWADFTNGTNEAVCEKCGKVSVIHVCWEDC